MRLLLVIGSLIASLEASLSFQDRYQIIMTELQKFKVADNVHKKILARWVKIAKKEDIMMLIEQAHDIAQEERGKKASMIMRDFEQAYYLLDAGYIIEPDIAARYNIDQKLADQIMHDQQYESSLHEAGHIVAYAKYPNSKFIAISATSVAREQAMGIYVTVDRFEDQLASDDYLEQKIIATLAGGVTEQVFHLQPLRTWDQVLKKYIHKIAYQPGELSFEELLNRGVSDDDLNSIIPLLQQLAESKLQQQGINDEDLEAKVIQDKKQELILRLYDQTVHFVKNHKKEITRLAKILEKDGFISMQQIYQECEMQRLRFDFEA